MNDMEIINRKDQIPYYCGMLGLMDWVYRSHCCHLSVGFCDLIAFTYISATDAMEGDDINVPLLRACAGVGPDLPAICYLDIVHQDVPGWSSRSIVACLPAVAELNGVGGFIVRGGTGHDM